jgi:hypothetical protein
VQPYYQCLSIAPLFSVFTRTQLTNHVYAHLCSQVRAQSQLETKQRVASPHIMLQLCEASSSNPGPAPTMVSRVAALESKLDRTSITPPPCYMPCPDAPAPLVLPLLSGLLVNLHHIIHCRLSNCILLGSIHRRPSNCFPLKSVRRLLFNGVVHLQRSELHLTRSLRE